MRAPWTHRAYENLEKAGAAKITASLIRATLEVLQIWWAKFEARYERLIDEFGIELKTHKYLIANFPTVEIAYLQQRARLEDLDEESVGRRCPSARAGSVVQCAASDPLASVFRQIRGLASLARCILIHCGQEDYTLR